MDPTEARKVRERCLKRLPALKQERATWESPWRDMADYIEPRWTRFFRAERNQGHKKESKIINGTATYNLGTLQSGMMASITSPARPWFQMTTHDPDLDAWGSVRTYLQQVAMTLRMAMLRSNFYIGLHALYGDLGLFGGGASILDEDTRQVLRSYHQPVGEYYLATSPRGDVDTCYIETTLTVGQLVRKFGLEVCSRVVRDAWDKSNYDQVVDVIRVIEPRMDADPDRQDREHMPTASIWFEVAGDADLGLLENGGYRESPLLAPRWFVTGNDIYGSGPGWKALGDVKALQAYERRKAQIIDKIADPPMQGPPELDARPGAGRPGGMTFTPPGTEIKPAVAIPPAAVTVVTQAVQEHERRLDRAFYADLWLMLSREQEGQPITAREVAERHEEKMLQLGPVLERLEDELLNPAVERVFGICLRRGLLPPPPQELQGRDLGVEYLSIMATAQKMVAVSGIQQTSQYALSLIPLDPTVGDKINTAKAIEKLADAVGVDVEILRTEEEVQQIRAQRQKQAQQQQALQTGMAAAQGAKALSVADTSGDNALTRILGPVAAAQASGQ